MIRNNYFKSWFFMDVVASLPIDMVMRIMNGEFTCSVEANCKVAEEIALDTDSGKQSARMIRLIKLVRILRLMKMLRLVRVQRILDRYQDELFTIISYIKIIKLLLILIFLGHIFGCFFYFFSTDEWRTPRERKHLDCHVGGSKECNGGSWIESNNIEKGSDASLMEMYTVASYWAFTTMTTVGYGDISASTIAERLWAILGMLVGGFVFSGLIGAMSKLINSRDLSKQAYKDKMDVVGAFVKDSKLPNELRLRVLRFFRRQEVHAYEEHSLLSQLPFKERMDMLWYNYGSLIMSVPVFRTANRMFLGEIMNSLEPMNLQPGTMIVYQGESASHVYLIAKGLVELLCDDGETIYRIMHMGSYFGEEAIFGDNCLAADGAVHTESVRVCGDGNVKLLRIPRNEMAEALDRHPEVLEDMQTEHEKRSETFKNAKLLVQGADTDGFLSHQVCDDQMKASPYYRMAVDEAALRAAAHGVPQQKLNKLVKTQNKLMQAQAKNDLKKAAISKAPNIKSQVVVPDISTPGGTEGIPACQRSSAKAVSPASPAAVVASLAAGVASPAHVSPQKLPPVNFTPGLSMQDMITAISSSVAAAVSQQMDTQVEMQKEQMSKMQERLANLENTVAAKLDQLALAVEAGGGEELDL